MRKLLIIATLLFSTSTFAQTTTNINDDLQVTQLTPKVFLYTAWADMGRWGRIGSNGLIVVDQNKAFMIDTPINDAETATLCTWIKDSLNATLTAFVPGHWHDDCVGGMAYLKSQNVDTYANSATNKILKSRSLPQAAHSFNDSMSYVLGQTDIKCYYLGGGHATDNIVVYIPSEGVLFGGCMLKDTLATTLGNTADAAPLTEWLNTICKVESHFPQAKIIVPGHGNIGGWEITKHSKKLLEQNIK